MGKRHGERRATAHPGARTQTSLLQLLTRRTTWWTQVSTCHSSVPIARLRCRQSSILGAAKLAARFGHAAATPRKSQHVGRTSSRCPMDRRNGGQGIQLQCGVIEQINLFGEALRGRPLQITLAGAHALTNTVIHPGEMRARDNAVRGTERIPTELRKYDELWSKSRSANIVSKEDMFVAVGALPNI